ncbi:hypothetical protein F383_36405 [Gossypium arboreum]|uniref:Uncharacterized protein n=1 Tax=Gossypium arboreum TaxID=29729 RepID=A0A0B0N8T9_GOSAR|nr:hypothetical protein F383_36405 [Gossypium arboreum]
MPAPIYLHMQQSIGSDLERYRVVFACVRERGRGARRLGRTEAWSCCPVAVAAQEKEGDLGFVLV